MVNYHRFFFESMILFIKLMIQLPKKLDVEPILYSNTHKRFSSNKSTPEQTLCLKNPADRKTWGFIVIDNTIRGQGLGGIRMVSDLTLTEVKRLAKIMTLKNSLAQLPFGGAKVGVILDSENFRDIPELRADFFAIFAEAIFTVDNFIPAPDMGTNESDIQIINETFSKKLGTSQHGRGGVSRPADKGGVPIDDWGLTAHGLLASVRSLEQLESGFAIKDSRVIVQGYGNVGASIAQKLSMNGACIVGASDINAALWHPFGLDINELNRVRTLPGGLCHYKKAETRRFFGDRLDWLIEAPCDLLIPCARPDSITSRNADRLECGYILQGANSPCNKMTEYYLWNRRGILSLSDIVVNSGGVIGCAAELKMILDRKFKKKVETHNTRSWIEDRVCRTVTQNVSEVYRRFRESKNDSIFREQAENLSKERLQADHQQIWL
tara:strand:+ start:5564 stop:6877 length:1314 start_codon:yes stop_codon:yes gene_type:complete